MIEAEAMDFEESEKQNGTHEDLIHIILNEFYISQQWKLLIVYYLWWIENIQVTLSMIETSKSENL